MDKKKALGRGMASLIPDAAAVADEASSPRTYFQCDIENIVPNKDQPRKNFAEKGMLELAASIEESGILQPLVVKRLANFNFEIIAGERRWRAAQKAGLRQVPVIIRQSSKSVALEEALIENIQREDLNEIEEALAYEGLIQEHGHTQEKLAKKLGKSRPAIANTLRLLALPQTVQKLVVDQKLSAGHARALLGLSTAEAQEKVAQEAVQKGLSVRELERISKEVRTPTQKSKPAAGEKEDYLGLLGAELSQHFKAKVRVSMKGKKGRIEIEAFGEDELNRIVALLKA